MTHFWSTNGQKINVGHEKSFTLYFGTSFINLSKVGLSKRHKFCNLSLDFPLDHFFLDFFEEPVAAFAFASFDFWGALAIFNQFQSKNDEIQYFDHVMGLVLKSGA